jgi:hypothetical protein
MSYRDQNTTNQQQFEQQRMLQQLPGADLPDNEKIEKLEHTNVVVAHVYPNRSDSLSETDADEYIKSNSINHTWKGKSMVMFSKWCENVNICPVTDETRDNIIN